IHDQGNSILVFTNPGKPGLLKFYQPYSEDAHQQIINLHSVSKRDENVCNILEGGLLIGALTTN
uniref:AP complex mu/sigma subunit domain-containing protein n=1 Tax=Prolemur simus TaxID=1328070 RepID=A0A8C8YET0_PROSS